MLNSLSFMIGSLSFGLVSDRFGRKLGLVLSLSIYALSTAVYAALADTGHLNLSGAIVLTCAINYGVGAEVGPSYAALSELMPAKHRGKLLMLALNFWNLGAALIASISLFYSKLTSELNTILTYTFLTAIFLSLIVLAARLHIAESPRWLIFKGRREEALDVVERFTGRRVLPEFAESERVGLMSAVKKYVRRLLILMVAVTVQLITYNLAAYYVPYAPGFPFGERAAPLIVAVSNLGASAGAIPFLFLIDKSRKAALLSSFALGAATSVILILTFNSFPLFAASLFMNMIFSEWAYGTVAVLEGELFPTGIRASAAGFITAVAWLTNSLLVGAMALLNAKTMLYFNFTLWMIGWLVATYWVVVGKETAGKSLEEASSEV